MSLCPTGAAHSDNGVCMIKVELKVHLLLLISIVAFRNKAYVIGLNFVPFYFVNAT